MWRLGKSFDFLPDGRVLQHQGLGVVGSVSSGPDRWVYNACCQGLLHFAAAVGAEAVAILGGLSRSRRSWRWCDGRARYRVRWRDSQGLVPAGALPLTAGDDRVPTGRERKRLDGLLPANQPKFVRLWGCRRCSSRSFEAHLDVDKPQSRHPVLDVSWLRGPDVDYSGSSGYGRAYRNRCWVSGAWWTCGLLAAAVLEGQASWMAQVATGAARAGTRPCRRWFEEVFSAGCSLYASAI